MREMAAYWHPGGNETGLVKYSAQCLARGRYPVYKAFHMSPHTPQLSWPTPFSGQPPAGLRIFLTFHLPSPTHSQPVTIVSGNKTLRVT